MMLTVVPCSSLDYLFDAHRNQAYPYNLRDFHDDKLSILDIKAVDANGAVYDIEMQLTIFEGIVQRIVFLEAGHATLQLIDRVKPHFPPHSRTVDVRGAGIANHDVPET